MAPLDPVLDDFESELETLPDGDPRARYLRINAWWTGNDVRRDARAVDPLSAFELSNLDALAAMLEGGDPTDRVMRGEVLRELGRFDEALAVLDANDEPDLATAVTFIRQLVVAKDPFVRQLLS